MAAATTHFSWPESKYSPQLLCSCSAGVTGIDMLTANLLAGVSRRVFTSDAWHKGSSLLQHQQ